MNGIKLLILDVLKPLGISIIEYAKAITKLNNALSVNIRVQEIDKKTESVEIIIKGDKINYEEIERVIDKLGGTVHSIDEISVGKELLNSTDYTKVHER